MAISAVYPFLPQQLETAGAGPYQRGMVFAALPLGVLLVSPAAGGGDVENMHSTDVESPPPSPPPPPPPPPSPHPPHVCMSIDPEGKSSSDIGSSACSHRPSCAVPPLLWRVGVLPILTTSIALLAACLVLSIFAGPFTDDVPGGASVLTSVAMWAGAYTPPLLSST